MKARSWSIVQVGLKIQLKIGKNCRKVASKWPKSFLNDFQFSYELFHAVAET
jgi:hypothetical protein